MKDGSDSMKCLICGGDQQEKFVTNVAVWRKFYIKKSGHIRKV